jgi:hypothetical protein
MPVCRYVSLRCNGGMLRGGNEPTVSSQGWGEGARPVVTPPDYQLSHERCAEHVWTGEELLEYAC